MVKPTEQPAPEHVDRQKEYLVEKFGNLIKQIGDGYGKPLQEELINRLEKTISDFHEEVEEVIETLKNNSEERQRKLKELWEKGTIEEEPETDVESSDVPEPELSEWEKRIERKSQESNPGQQKPAGNEKEKSKKKGLFGKKK